MGLSYVYARPTVEILARVWKRLESARPVELHKLAEVVALPEAKVKEQAVLVEELSKDIRHAAGHSLNNLLRGPHDFPCKQMQIDVADKLAPGRTFLSWTGLRLNDRHSELEVEEKVWEFWERRVVEKVRGLSPEAREDLRKETEADLRAMGYSEALVTQIGAGLVGGAVGALVGPALAYQMAINTAGGLAWLKLWWAGHASAAATFGAGAALFSVAYLPALFWWLGNTAYRKTIPATLQLIQIRKLRELEAALS